MSQMRAVFLDQASVDRGDLDYTSVNEVANWTYYSSTSPQEVKRRVSGHQIVVTNKVVIDRALMEDNDQLKLIVVAATGTNNIDMSAAEELGIPVKNVTAYATESVVQHVFMLIFNLLTRYNEYQQALAHGAWQKSEFFCLLDYPIQTLAGKTVGIIGYGELGKAVAKVATIFGAEVIIAQRLGSKKIVSGRTPLKQLLAQSDIVSLHCPLADNTENIINAERLAHMKPDSILINTARGGLVDEAALLAAIDSGHIAGAALDTLVTEPPLEDALLLKEKRSNIIVTPHIAWASKPARQLLLDKVAKNIMEFFA